MAELKVRVLDDVEQKSKQQVEEELLQKHEEQFVDKENTTTEAPKEEAPIAEAPSAEEKVEKSSFKDEDVLSYIGEKYGKTINSLDELFESKQTSPELPEDVAAYFKYKQETGRSIEDFVNLNKDFSKVDQDELLANYYQATDDYLDKDDVASMLEEFEYDEDLDDEKNIKKVKLAKKKAVSEARKYFEKEKEKYKMPLESRDASIDSETQRKLDEHQASLKNVKENEERSAANRKTYLQKLDEVFNGDFKGFEFKIDDHTLAYKPTSVEELKTSNNDFTNFVKGYLGEDGQIKDHVGFHRALAIANHPDKFAKFFYDKGRADSVTDDAKTTKNIDLSIKKAPEVSNKGGLQIKAITPGSDGNSLKIRKRK